LVGWLIFYVVLIKTDDKLGLPNECDRLNKAIHNGVAEVTYRDRVVSFRKSSRPNPSHSNARHL